MNQMMQLMMPVMFGVFTMQFASGLAIYFVISNVIGILMQLIMNRMMGLSPLKKAEAPSDGKGEKKKHA